VERYQKRLTEILPTNCRPSSSQSMLMKSRKLRSFCYPELPRVGRNGTERGTKAEEKLRAAGQRPSRRFRPCATEPPPGTVPLPPQDPTDGDGRGAQTPLQAHSESIAPKKVSPLTRATDGAGSPPKGSGAQWVPGVAATARVPRTLHTRLGRSPFAGRCPRTLGRPNPVALQACSRPGAR
jgi:hypothetical protein